MRLGRCAASFSKFSFGKQIRFTTQKELSVCLLGYIWYINPFMPNGISNLYQLDESILN